MSGEDFFQTKLDDTLKIVWRDWTDRRLGAAGDSSLFIQKTSFNEPSNVAKRHRICEIEIASWLY